MTKGARLKLAGVLLHRYTCIKVNQKKWCEINLASLSQSPYVCFSISGIIFAAPVFFTSGCSLKLGSCDVTLQYRPITNKLSYGVHSPFFVVYPDFGSTFTRAAGERKDAFSTYEDVPKPSLPPLLRFLAKGGSGTGTDRGQSGSEKSIRKIACLSFLKTSMSSFLNRNR